RLSYFALPTASFSSCAPLQSGRQTRAARAATCNRRLMNATPGSVARRDLPQTVYTGCPGLSSSWRGLRRKRREPQRHEGPQRSTEKTTRERKGQGTDPAAFPLSVFSSLCSLVALRVFVVLWRSG